MIVQTAPHGAPHFIIANADHAQTAAELAAAWGNDGFPAFEPRDLIQYVVANHEEGWRKPDTNPQRDPDTGLPYHLTNTPHPILVEKGRRSPEFNEVHHPFCGLLSSMHVRGLYNRRYGLSDAISIDNIPAEDLPLVDAMVTDEERRQERLKLELAKDPATAPWVEPERLFYAYKLLEFFDTLALYFQTVHYTRWERAIFRNVPRAVGDDVTITVEPVGGQTVKLTPYVFSGPLIVAVKGRYLRPQPKGADLKAILGQSPLEKQSYRLVPPLPVGVGAEPMYMEGQK
jgi:hypothetical protein